MCFLDNVQFFRSFRIEFLCMVYCFFGGGAKGGGEKGGRERERVKLKLSG
jgi:hypothetical protein